MIVSHGGASNLKQLNEFSKDLINLLRSTGTSQNVIKCPLLSGKNYGDPVYFLLNLSYIFQSFVENAKNWMETKLAILVTVVNLGSTKLLTTQVISVAFYSEREKSDKFSSETLISAWGSFTCRKSTTRDPRLYFSSEGSILRIFTL